MSLRFLSNILVETRCTKSGNGFTEGDRYLFWDDLGDRYLHQYPGNWNCAAPKKNFQIVSVQNVTTVEMVRRDGSVAEKRLLSHHA